MDRRRKSLLSTYRKGDKDNLQIRDPDPRPQTPNPSEDEQEIISQDKRKCVFAVFTPTKESKETQAQHRQVDTYVDMYILNSPRKGRNETCSVAVCHRMSAEGDISRRDPRSCLRTRQMRRRRLAWHIQYLDVGVEHRIGGIP